MNNESKNLIVAAALITMLVQSAVDGADVNRPPNVVFILADDLGYGDLHCYGHPYARTPNLDRLASEGTRFRQFYSTGVTCCPARTGLMTSKFPATYPTYPAVGGFADRITITQLLKQAGYHTGHFGKWHIGPTLAAGTYGIDCIGADNEGEDALPRAKKRQRSETGRDTHIYDDAIRFIEKNKDGPFYVNVWSHISHFPVNPAEKFVAEFQNLKVKDVDFSEYMREKFQQCRATGGDVDASMRRYLGDIYSLDQDIGRLLTKLDELGLHENTIVVFSSDQGPGGVQPPAKDKDAAAEKLELRLNMLGYAGGLRGGKHRQYEGGVRVPFIIRWPGHVPAGRSDEKSVISGIDWLPTLCQIAGVKINPADFDGEDVSQSWLGQEHARTKPLLWKTSASNSDPAIRDGQWKLHGSHRQRGEVELYDISADPGETHNLAADKPEIVKALTAKLQAWQATLPKEYVKTPATGD
jgi:arylsulfatase A-like enzyme